MTWKYAAECSLFWNIFSFVILTAFSPVNVCDKHRWSKYFKIYNTNWLHTQRLHENGILLGEGNLFWLFLRVHFVFVFFLHTAVFARIVNYKGQFSIINSADGTTIYSACDNFVMNILTQFDIVFKLEFHFFSVTVDCIIKVKPKDEF